jgi:alpha-tubulin suppressor-like RCC1 family protein
MREYGFNARTYRYGFLLIVAGWLAFVSNVASAQYRVFIWGKNAEFQLGTAPPSWTDGHNTYYGRSIPGFIPAFNVGAVASGSIVQIAAGDNHTLALKNDGTIWAWGDNTYGQLGNGSGAANSDRPVQVARLTGVIAIAAGGSHSIALKSDGTVWTWGANNNGQLSIGTTSNPSLIPVQVTLYAPVTQIAAGANHCIALQNDGTIWLWGSDGSGQLGNNSGDQNEPARLVQFSNVIQIAAGGNNSLAQTKDGNYWAWGAINTQGPVKISGLSNVTQFSLNGVYPLILKNDGTLWYLTNSGGLQVVQASGISNVVAVSSSANFDLVARKDGTVWSLGVNYDGDLGNGTATSTSGWNWVQAKGVSNVVQAPTGAPHFILAAGAQHSIALESDGKLWSWGDNEYGQLSLRSPEDQSRPTRPRITLGSVVSAAAGKDGNGNAYYLFLHKDGTIWSWGSGGNGQLGDGGTADTYTTTTQVYNFSGAVQVAANQNASSYAVKNDGTVWGWGNNNGGQLGDGTTTERNVATQVVNLTGVTAIAPATYHVLALRSDGTVWAWGDNTYGELGDGTYTGRTTPGQVSGLTNIIAIGAGERFSMALKADGTVWTWGDNGYDELGGSTGGNVPGQVPSLSGIVAIAAGNIHAMALKSDGTVFCWGDNTGGELGNGTTTDSATPQQVPNLTDVVAIFAGDDGFGGESFAIKSDHSVWAWGNDRHGQLGDGALTLNSGDFYTLAQPNPTQVFLQGVTKIISGGSVTLALVKDVDPDFNGDGNSDLLWQNSLTAQQQVWYMDGASSNYQTALFGTPISDTWTLAGAADLTNNGQYDLIWQNNSSGKVNDWLMNGITPVSYVHVYPITPAEWHVVGGADINNDFFPDLIWQNTQTQAVKICYLNNGVWNQQNWDLLFNLPAGWLVAGTADIDGDGYPDIIAQNTTTGAVRVWYLKGNQWTGATDDLATQATSPGRLASIQDLDGDNGPDLIWQTSTGSVICWPQDVIGGYSLSAITLATGVAAGWSIARAH